LREEGKKKKKEKKHNSTFSQEYSQEPHFYSTSSGPYASITLGLVPLR